MLSGFAVEGNRTYSGTDAQREGSEWPLSHGPWWPPAPHLPARTFVFPSKAESQGLSPSKPLTVTGHGHHSQGRFSVHVTAPLPRCLPGLSSPEEEEKVGFYREDKRPLSRVASQWPSAVTSEQGGTEEDAAASQTPGERTSPKAREGQLRSV